MKIAPIRILHVVFSLDPGGMENGLVNVASRLDPAEFVVDVCCLTQAGEFASRLPEASQVCSLQKPPGFSLRTVLQLARTISQCKPHVIHSHNPGCLIYTALATAGGLSRPILHGEHGFTAVTKPESILRYKHFYKVCRQIHTVSASLRTELIELGLPEKKIMVILNGVDTDRFSTQPREQARAQLGLSLDGPVFGVVGRFDRQKRHLVILDAFDQIATRWPRAQLLLVGDKGNQLTEVLARVKQSPAANRIHLAGFQPEPTRYYQAMDLLVSASEYEGLSNVVLEAMACGVPALTHQACGNNEIILPGENGWVANLVTPKALVTEWERILASPEELRRRGTSALTTVKERFSMETMVRNYARVYRQLAR